METETALPDAGSNSNVRLQDGCDLLPSMLVTDKGALDPLPDVNDTGLFTPGVVFYDLRGYIVSLLSVLLVILHTHQSQTRNGALAPL